MSDLSQITIDSFASTLNELISANVHSRGKGNAFKQWCIDNFELDSRIAYIKSQQQLTNRVSEQFRYFSPIVVFVCNPDVKRDTLLKYIFERGYKELRAIAIVGVSISGEGNTAKATFEYEQLLVYRKCNFASWAEAIFAKSDNAYTLMEQNGTSVEQDSDALQVIYYGAPGTGKSHKVKQITGEEDNKNLPNVFRTIFHPDTDYATFVGCYKPTMKPVEEKYRAVAGKEEDIAYEFVPQAFTDAYVYAYNNPNDNTYLVIEEINRGNCAQIFGDLFQLLDRNSEGKSEYTIKADKDLAKYLVEKLGEDSEGIADGKLCLPANFNILATMNTSDQSLFPMDSAFKRRWDWEYVAIDYEESKSNGFEIILSKDIKYNWCDFIKQVNKRIFALTQSEDKELGNFFIKKSINAKQFKSKVMFYLWYEVLRDEVENSKYFFYYIQKNEDTGKESTKKFTFKELYGDNAETILAGFLRYITEGAVE